MEHPKRLARPPDGREVRLRIDGQGPRLDQRRPHLTEKGFHRFDLGTIVGDARMREQVERDLQTRRAGEADTLEDIVERISTAPVLSCVDARSERLKADPNGL